jgi:histidinol phosphatase-like PHP family hydrolase
MTSTVLKWVTTDRTNPWDEIKFFDCHAHTADLSYCCDSEITVQTYAQYLKKSTDCAGSVITNHGFSIYFPSQITWEFEYMLKPQLWDDYREWGNQRFRIHLNQIDSLRDQGLYSGIETDMMIDGRLTCDEKLRDRLDVIVGGVHVVPAAMADPHLHPAEIFTAWWIYTEQLMQAGIDILSHPFRWISKQSGIRLKNDHVREIVSLAKRYGVALEVNTHQNINTDVEMVRLCTQEGVPISIGTDAHHRTEILNFRPHRKILKKARISPEEIKIWQPN